MKLTEIKCNGMSSLSHIADLTKPYVMTAIGLFRMRHSISEIEREINKVDPNADYMFGRRCNDDETIYYRIASAVSGLALREMFGNKPELTDEEYESLQKFVLEFIEGLSGADMDTLIIDSFRDCASSDHWYTYEKQWD